MIWIIFFAIIFILLYFDLHILYRKAHTIEIREAIRLSTFWILLSIIFGIGVYFLMGNEKALLFFTGYIVEKSLSVDNLFVFIVIFSYFGIENRYQHKVLYWGILGALITRGIFIFAGVTLINKFHFILYFFGIFLIYTAFKLLKNGDDEVVDPSQNVVVKYFSKYFRVSTEYDGKSFFTKGCITPLFIVLLVIETTDIMFAFDSIPAVLSITTDPFIVYTSNIFAILGLRALYFVLMRTMAQLYYLNYGLAVVLSFIGLKMLISSWYEIPTIWSLGIVAGILGIAFVLSIWVKPTKP